VLGAEYPDGDTTLRLRWGRIAGFRRQGQAVEPWVRLSDLFALAGAQRPFLLPESWRRARPRLDGKVPLAFAADLDPVIIVDERDQDVGGPVFDRNLGLRGIVIGGTEAVAGSRVQHDPEARAVVLTSAAILEVLAKVYGARELVDELSRAAPSLTLVRALTERPPRGTTAAVALGARRRRSRRRRWRLLP
jgi:hypothetical protein